MDKALYKRVIIKLSGEALAGEKGNGIDEKILDSVVDQIIDVKNLGVEIGIIVGGGNFWRGRQGREMDRTWGAVPLPTRTTPGTAPVSCSMA